MSSWKWLIRKQTRFFSTALGLRVQVISFLIMERFKNKNLWVKENVIF